MAGREDSIAVRNVLEGYLNADNNAMASSVGTAYNPTYALVSEAGAQIVLFINNADYKMYAQLKDKNGNLLYTSNIIDLPLESVVMNGRYDSTTKEVVLILVNGNEIRFSVADLVRGLVDEDQLEEALSGYWSKEDLTEEDIENWNNKQDYLNQGENVQIYSDLSLKGQIQQDSTTGKNLLPISPFNNGYSLYTLTDDVVTQNNTTSAGWEWGYARTFFRTTLSAGTYTLMMFADKLSTNNSAEFRVYKNDNTMLADSGTHQKNETGNISFTLSEETQIGVVAKTYDGAWKFMLVTGSTPDYNYEKFTNGASPNPSYPQDIHIVSGDNEIKVQNKNYWSIGNIESVGWATNSSKLLNLLNTLKAGTYTLTLNYKVISIIKASTRNMCGCYFNNSSYGTYIKRDTINSISIGQVVPFNFSITIREQDVGKFTVVYLYGFGNDGEGTTGTSNIVNSQLEQGSTATDYVPHQEYTKEINLGELEVGGIGEYEDEFFKNTTDSEYYDSTLELDKWYLKKRIGKVVLDGSVDETWTYELVNNLDMFKYNNTNMLKGNALGGYCNYYYNTNGTSTFKDGVIRFGWGNKYLYFMNDTSRFSGTISNFTTWLSTHNITLYYILATPENILLNDTLQEQLNGLSANLSDKEMINIIQENNDLPFEINYDNTKLTIDVPCAGVDQGGVIKTSDSYATATADGVLTSQTKTYAQYNSLDNNAFVSKGTLENVLNKYIGDIDTALDAINGEVI